MTIYSRRIRIERAVEGLLNVASSQSSWSDQALRHDNGSTGPQTGHLSDVGARRHLDDACCRASYERTVFLASTISLHSSNSLPDSNSTCAPILTLRRFSTELACCRLCSPHLLGLLSDNSLLFLLGVEHCTWKLQCSIAL